MMKDRAEVDDGLSLLAGLLVILFHGRTGMEWRLFEGNILGDEPLSHHCPLIFLLGGDHSD